MGQLHLFFEIPYLVKPIVHHLRTGELLPILANRLDYSGIDL
jgi:hypothetical protein